MEFHFERWFKTIKRLQDKFNGTSSPVERLALLVALRETFTKESAALTEEVKRYERIATRSLIGE